MTFQAQDRSYWHRQLDVKATKLLNFGSCTPLRTVKEEQKKRWGERENINDMIFNGVKFPTQWLGKEQRQSKASGKMINLNSVLLGKKRWANQTIQLKFSKVQTNTCRREPEICSPE